MEVALTIVFVVGFLVYVYIKYKAQQVRDYWALEAKLEAEDAAMEARILEHQRRQAGSGDGSYLDAWKTAQAATDGRPVEERLQAIRDGYAAAKAKGLVD